MRLNSHSRLLHHEKRLHHQPIFIESLLFGYRNPIMEDINSLKQIIGCSTNEATHYLEIFQGNFERAVCVVLEHREDVVMPETSICEIYFWNIAKQFFRVDFTKDEVVLKIA